MPSLPRFESPFGSVVLDPNLAVPFDDHFEWIDTWASWCLLAPLTMRLVFDIFGLFAETNAFGVQLKYANYNPLVLVRMNKFSFSFLVWLAGWLIVRVGI